MNEITAVMTQEEARQITEDIRRTGNSLRSLLILADKGGAWIALNYASMNSYLLGEFPEFSEVTLYRELQAARTEKILELPIGSYRESTIRPLARNEFINNPTELNSVWEQVVATAPEGKITAAHVQAVVDEIKDNKPHVSFNSGNNEWYTPAEYIEAARRVMGGIDLDPASSDIANKTVKADVYLTAQDDGLIYSWNGRVWMNPPYSGELIGKFSAKLVEHYKAGDISEAIVLVNNATETAWYQGMMREAEAICFIKGRIRFIDMQGTPSGAPLQGQTLLYFGDNPDKFAEAFWDFGVVLYAR